MNEIKLPPIKFDTTFIKPTDVDFKEVSSFFHFFLPLNRTKEMYERLKQDEDLILAIIKNTTISLNLLKTLEGIYSSVSLLRRYEGVRKARAVARLINEELKKDIKKKFAVFCVHADVMHEIRRNVLPIYRTQTCFNNIDPADRRKKIRKFHAYQSYKVFISNIMAAGNGIELSNADEVLFVELDWYFYRNVQAILRVHNMRRKKPVRVRFIALTDSNTDSKIIYIFKRYIKKAVTDTETGVLTLDPKHDNQAKAQ
ncbi:MAG TPA: hypothetical protein P5523_04845 [Bacteroidales bacterium]|mgnify:CR=1 FL=1|nr:hypothetical protein [Bacteroidales bacterium]